VRSARIRSLLLFLAAAPILAGCGRKITVPNPDAVASPGMVEEGIASWYGHPYHGRRTASGETYDMEKLTAAHRTLPFGTQVRVESLANHKSVEVRINDRGPSSMDRLIDLSRAAARRLDMIGPGTARVRLAVLTVLENARGNYYAVQVGAFQDKKRAERLRHDMEKQFGSAKLVAMVGKPILWRVLVGRISNMEAADELARRIRKESRDKAGTAFIVRLD
jgi:rare lipoprotein A